MIKLIQNADAKVKSQVLSKSTQDHYVTVCEHYALGRLSSFISEMQLLVTRLGNVVASVDVNRSSKGSCCMESIHYLCVNVLDNPKQMKTFQDIHLNLKGNREKHFNPEETNIDMLRCVTAFNSLITRIADIYGLRSLECLIVRKMHRNAPAQRPNNQKPVVISSPAPTPAPKPIQKPAPAPTPTPKKKKHPASASTSDENVKFTATLEHGNGRYTKGIFDKREMINCKMNISIQNQKSFKITGVSAFIKGKWDTLEKKLPTSLKSNTDIDLPVDEYGDHIEASVVVTYKIGAFKTKQVKTTVSRNF